MSLPATIDVTDSDTFEEVDKELASYFQTKLGNLINNLPHHMRLRSEAEIISDLRPTPLDYAIRRSFWKAVDTAKSVGKEKIPTARIYEGVCTRNWFEEAFIVNPLRLAWMLRPIVPHEAFYEAINKAAIEKILTIVEQAEIDPKMLPILAKIAEMSANRAFGAVVQKTQIQSRNLNVELKQSHGGDSPPPPDQLQLSQKIEAMQAQLMATPKDVTPKE